MAATTGDVKNFDYAIVGGGCLGASTALALIREWPDARIIWFEGDDAHTASRDINKIIRAPYPDKDYVAFATKAMELWRSVDLYREFFHRVGWIQVVPQDNHSYMIEGPNDRMISTKEMQQMVGSQSEPKLDQGEKLRLNENIGYVDFKSAVEAVAKQASLLGVRREQRNITKLLTDNGVSRGVEAGDESFMAKKTIVAAGAWTPGILERSRVEFPSDFFTVAGVGVAVLHLDEKESDELKSMPILIADTGDIVPSMQHKALKVSTINTFRIQHPQDLKELKSFDVGKNRTLLEKMLPQFTGRELEWWICPDLMTPYEHPLVDWVPGTEQLLLVAGGSYHSAKFLPVIGEMAVRRLRGQYGSDSLEDRLLRRWTWDRSAEKVAVHGKVRPRDSLNI